MLRMKTFNTKVQDIDYPFRAYIYIKIPIQGLVRT